MGKKVMNGIKEGLSVFVPLVIVTITLDFLKLGIGYNRSWTYLDSLGIINFFDERPSNGLVVLGFLLDLIAFVLALFSPDKRKNKQL